MTPDPAHPDELRTLTFEQVCQILPFCPRTVEKLIRADEFPRPIQLGRKRFWHAPAVVKWLAARQREAAKGA